MATSTLRARLPHAQVIAALFTACALTGAAQSNLFAEEAASNVEIEVTPTDWKQRSQLQTRARSSFAWGQNLYKIVAPSAEAESLPSNIKKPRKLPLLDDMVLRDLRLHERYAVAVDERGDVLQWGDGHHDIYTDRPHKALCHQDIIKIAPTRDKIYALSRAGNVYIFPVDQTMQKDLSKPRSSSKSWWQFWLADAGIDNVTMTPDVVLSSADKFIDIAAGESHLIALTKQGRVYASPVDRHANERGQLAVRQLQLTSGPATFHPTGFEPEDSSPRQAKSSVKPSGLVYSKDFPRAWLSDEQKSELDRQTARGVASPTLDEPVHDDGDIRYCTTLHQIPSLQKLQISQVAAGDHHTLVRTNENRVLGFGANNYGQLGLGTALAFPVIPTPSEVNLARAYSKDVKLQCESISAGGSSTYFVVKRQELRNAKEYIDVLACGHGQFGGIGNGQWSHQGAPVRVKTISGLQEWSEIDHALLPISIHNLSVGKNHVVATLDNAVVQKDARYGRDVFVWGQNAEWQLGNGRRSNLSVPQHLPPLPHDTDPVNLHEEDKKDWNIESRMPHNRLQLTPAVIHGKYRVEETMVAGWNTTAVFWKIVE